MSDFTLTPDYVYSEKKQYKTLKTNFENGAVQTRAKWSSPLRTFRLVFKNRPYSDVTTLMTLFDSKYGGYGSFTFTNPNDSTEYTVRFSEDTLDVENKAYDVYDFSLSLEEVK